LIYLKLSLWELAIDDYSSALRLNPKLATALYGRGFAKLKNADQTGEVDIAAAKAIEATIEGEFARYGLQ
jgi:tetratricopeptide (TPR) repeat protein